MGIEVSVYKGAIGLWESPRRVGGRLVKPGELIPEITLQEATARADLQPVFEATLKAAPAPQEEPPKAEDKVKKSKGGSK